MIPTRKSPRFMKLTLSQTAELWPGIQVDTPRRQIGAGTLQSSGAKRKRDYERPAAAAAAFLAALAAVEALRRRLVFGGVAGASPISSATIMLVTNNLGP